MKTVNIFRFLLSQSEAVANDDELLWLQIQNVFKVTKTSKFQKIKKPTAAVLPLAALVLHTLDTPRSRLASDTDNAED